MFGVRLFILFACLSWSYCKLDKYCSLCNDHTMCKYHGIGEECQGPGGSGVTDKDKTEIVGMHNWLRGIVASGSENRGTSGKQPKAANLMKMEWDDDLAKVAQRWADQCHFYHDTCRDDPRWKVGQNIFWSWKYPKHNVNWTEAILSWYEEVALFDSKDVDSYRFQAATGHYTQMLWHDTSAVGCGRKDYGPNKLYVCNYGPAGNWVSEPMYKTGEPCSECPGNTVCDNFLCATKPPGEQKKPASLDSNFLRMLPEKETGNETGRIKVLVPTGQIDEEVYAREKAFLCQNQTQQNPFLNSQNDDYIDCEGNEKATTNSIDENGIELDQETKRKIEDIKKEIEKMVKIAVKKSNANH